jgi:hypothetical protein
MKSQLDVLVKKIFGDENTRLEFQSDPEKFLAQYDLSEQEKKAVLLTNSNLGLVTSGSMQLEATLKGNDGWLAPAP